MFWVFVLIAVALIFGLSWLAGSFISKRGPAGKGGKPGGMSRQDAINAAKVSGAFSFRKENQP